MDAQDGQPACPVCSSSTSAPIYDPYTDETVCRQCGAVLDICSTTQSARQLNEGADSQNTPTLGQELGGHVGSAAGPARDASGRMVKDIHGVRRQRRWQQRAASRTGMSDSMRTGTAIIRTLADKLSLPAGVSLYAESLCCRACKVGVAQGRTAAAVAAAAVLLAARWAGLPRRVAEIEEAADIRNLAYHYRVLCERLDVSPPPPDPDIYVTRTVAALALPTTVSRLASDILIRAKSVGATGGRNPAVLASAAVFLGAAILENRQVVSAEKVALAADVSPSSVRQCAAMLRGTVVPEAASLR